METARFFPQPQGGLRLAACWAPASWAAPVGLDRRAGRGTWRGPRRRAAPAPAKARLRTPGGWSYLTASSCSQRAASVSFWCFCGFSLFVGSPNCFIVVNHAAGGAEAGLLRQLPVRRQSRASLAWQLPPRFLWPGVRAGLVQFATRVRWTVLPCVRCCF